MRTHWNCKYAKLSAPIDQLLHSLIKCGQSLLQLDRYIAYCNSMTYVWLWLHHAVDKYAYNLHNIVKHNQEIRHWVHTFRFWNSRHCKLHYMTV